MAEYILQPNHLIIAVVIIIVIILLSRNKKSKMYERYDEGDIIAKTDKYGNTRYMQRTDKDGFGAWKFVKEPKHSKKNY